MFPVYHVWSKPTCKARWKGEEDKVDKGRGGKTTSGNGQAWSSPSPRGRWRTGKNGGNWWWNHLWCSKDPRGWGINHDHDDENNLTTDTKPLQHFHRFQTKRSLQLPADVLIDYTILSLVYSCTNGTAPWYLRELIHRCLPAPYLVFASPVSTKETTKNTLESEHFPLLHPNCGTVCPFSERA